MNAVKNSTATGTTATADREAPPYRGRFAPSPTGLLHPGSLVAALASWLDARAHGGTWLIRMDDLDGPRCLPGADRAILSTLECLGLISDEPVLYQSTRQAAYAAALERLEATGRIYRCSCSRTDEPGPYSGHCRNLGLRTTPSAWRLRLEDGAMLQFHDQLQGECRYSTAALGDPVIFRRDGIAAYQLATVVDDAAQGITHVVRGADLLDSTAWQISIARALSLAVPRHAHLPLITEPDGTKLSKSRRAVALSRADAAGELVRALWLLRQQPPDELKAAEVSDILGWAVGNWRPDRLAGIRTVRLDQ